ncbi:MAG: BTB/POZ domain-containing protein, partial [Sphingobacteriales bacterium]
MNKIILALLKYLYGKVLEIKEEFALDLYNLTKEWSIQDLNIECREFLKNNMTMDNFSEIANKAQEIDTEDL